MSPSGTQVSSNNRLLTALSPDDLALLKPHLKPQALPLRHVLEKPGQPVEQIYFLKQGLASIVGNAGGDRSAETGMIGWEGMTGTCLVMGAEQPAHEMFIQLEGDGLRIDAAELRSAMDKSRSLHQLLLRYVRTLMVQMTRFAVRFQTDRPE